MTGHDIPTILEIARDDEGRLPAELMIAAYRASQNREIIFLLDGVTAQQVDLILDPIVASLPLDIPGVRYIPLGDMVESSPS